MFWFLSRTRTAEAMLGEERVICRVLDVPHPVWHAGSWLSPVPAQMWHGVRPVAVQMGQERAESCCRCVTGAHAGEGETVQRGAGGRGRVRAGTQVWSIEPEGARSAPLYGRMKQRGHCVGTLMMLLMALGGCSDST